MASEVLGCDARHFLQRLSYGRETRCRIELQ